MKKLTISAALMFAAMLSNAQNPIKLTKGTIDLDAGTVKEHTASTVNVGLPSSGSDKNWNYSSLTGGAAFTHGYIANKSSAFSKTAVIDTGGQGMFTPYETYPANRVFDEDTKGYFYAGDQVPYYASQLEEVTGDPNDILVIPAQNNIINGRDDIIKFTATGGSSWTGSYVKTLKFNLTLEFLGMSNVPCTEVSYTTVKNTVVGWGDLKTPAAKKENKDGSDVLMIRREVITIDSIFFAGTAAPDWLLNAFGTAQGAPTTISYTESFYKKGGFRPMLTFDFGQDKTWSTLSGITYLIRNNDEKDDESVSTLIRDANGQIAENDLGITNIEGAAGNSSLVSVYPNPAVSGTTINCRFIKNEEGPWNIKISNAVGQVVQTIPVSGTGIMNVPVEIRANTQGGLYLLNIITDDGNLHASSKINISR
jgi:hypothetical protein